MMNAGTYADVNQNVRMVNPNIEQLKKTTPCFGCGEIGHWKKQCPYLLQMQQNANQNPVVGIQPVYGQLQANVVSQQQSMQNL